MFSFSSRLQYGSNDISSDWGSTSIPILGRLYMAMTLYMVPLLDRIREAGAYLMVPLTRWYHFPARFYSKEQISENKKVRH